MTVIIVIMFFGMCCVIEHFEKKARKSQLL